MEKDETIPQDEEVQQTIETHEEESDTSDQQEVEEESQDQKDYRAKLNANNRFLEKEGYTWKDGKWVKPQTTERKADVSGTLSSIDVLVLSKEGVDIEDIDEVITQARAKKLSIAEVLKTPYIKSYLRDRAEERKTASVTVTKGTRGVQKSTGEALLERAQAKNEVPTNDSDLAALVEARIARLKNRNKR